MSKFVCVHDLLDMLHLLVESQQVSIQVQYAHLLTIVIDCPPGNPYSRHCLRHSRGLGGTYADSTNRAPEDMKVSWKWRSDYHSQNSYLQYQYKQVLSQVNFYMGLHNARHGFLLTNTELVAVKRLDKNGRLAVSSSIPWRAGGHGQLSVLMGLWYLGRPTDTIVQLLVSHILGMCLEQQPDRSMK